MSATPIGRTLAEHCRVVGAISPYLFDRIDCDLDELRRLLERYEQVVFVISHGGMISWAPAYAAFVQQVGQLQPWRRGTGTFHRIMWKTPGLRTLAQFITGVDRHYRYDELLAALRAGPCDFWAFPESDSSMFGALEQVKPFRFVRFIELSLEARMPMLLVAHRGSESWYRQLSVGPIIRDLARRAPGSVFSMLELDREITLRALEQGRIQLPLPTRRLHLRLKVAPYVPVHLEKGLASDPKQRRAQLVDESERIRKHLQAMVASLG